MHSCLGVDEILQLVARELVASEAKGTAVLLACCYRNLEDPVLDRLWETQDRITPLLKCLPQEVWKEERGSLVSQFITLLFPMFMARFSKSLVRIPTKAEWAKFRKYTRRMRALEMYGSD